MTITQIKQAVWLEAARIARENTYMNKKALHGGNFGGPSSCEYCCGDVLADEFERMANEEGL